MLKLVLMSIGNFLWIPFWHLQCCIKRNKKLWVFGAWDGLRYSDNSRALYEYILQNSKDIKVVWITRSPKIYNDMRAQHLPVEMANSYRGIKTTCKASRIFITEGFKDINPRFAHGAQLINLWHGMPLKQIGNDALLFIRPNNLWKRTKTAIRKVLVPWEFIQGSIPVLSPFFTPFLQSAFQIKKEQLWEIGTPRNDRFFEVQTEALIEKLNIDFNGPTKVMYMPTFRDACTQNGQVFNPFETAGFDMLAFERMLEAKNMVFMYKGHFCDTKSKGLVGQTRILTITDNDYDDLYRFLKDVDVLVTDYSSIYFDFLLCRKPIILFPFDQAEYIAHSRPFYCDYNLLEAPKVYSWNELTEMLAAGNYIQPTETEIQRFHRYADGNSCKRILQKLTSE